MSLSATSPAKAVGLFTQTRLLLFSLLFYFQGSGCFVLRTASRTRAMEVKDKSVIASMLAGIHSFFNRRREETLKGLGVN